MAGSFALAIRIVGLAITLAYMGPLSAANGFIQPGNSAAELGMAGAGTALSESPAANLRNPAAGAWMESGLALQMGLAQPDWQVRSGPIGSSSLFGILEIDPVRTENVSGLFPVPALSYNHRLDKDRAWGIGVRFSGLQSSIDTGSATLARGFPGFATRCQGIFGGGLPLAGEADINQLCGRAGHKAGAELAQLLLSVNFSHRLRPGLSVGIAPVLVGQRLVIRGLSAFRPFSVNPSSTSDEGADVSWGGALQLGLIWEPMPALRLGLALQSQTLTRPFQRYDGVLVDGKLNSPPVLDIGLSVSPVSGHKIILDYQRIWHSQIPSLSNRIDADRVTNGCLLPRLTERFGLGAVTVREDQACLGGADGPGFGLRNLHVLKIGYQWNSKRLAIRAGMSWTQAPLGNEQILVAAFAPAVTRRHEALGLSWLLTPKLSLDTAVIHAARERLSAPNSISNVNASIGISPLLRFEAEADPADQQIEVELESWQVQFGLNWHFGERAE